MGRIHEPGAGSGNPLTQKQHRGRALQGQNRKTVHRGDADDVDLCLQAAGALQCLESIRQPAGKRRRLRTSAACLLTEPGKRHILRQQRLLPRLQDRGSGGNPGSD